MRRGKFYLKHIILNWKGFCNGYSMHNIIFVAHMQIGGGGEQHQARNYYTREPCSLHQGSFWLPW